VRGNSGLCTSCNSQQAIWRCKECFGVPSYCSACCRRTHARLPFHQVESWSGSFYQPSWLHLIGVCLYLGHGGDPCPTVATERNNLWRSYNICDGETSDNRDTDDFATQDNHFHLADRYPKSGDLNVNGRPIMIMVDVSGVHHIGIEFCCCINAQPRDSQLMTLGLFPAMFNNPQTAFTFRVLDDFLLDNLACKTTAMNYYLKLQRITNSSFPQFVPVSSFHIAYERPYFRLLELPLLSNMSVPL